MKTEKNRKMELAEKQNKTATKSDLKPLLVDDVLYYKKYYGHLNHNYTWQKAKVVRVTKKMAEMDTGDKVYREPRISKRTGQIDFPAWTGFNRSYFPIMQIGN